MKRSLGISIVLVALVFCQLVNSVPQQGSINSSSNGNGSRDRGMSGRMISTNGGENRVHHSETDEDYDGDNSDSNFDSGPQPIGDSSEITFPVDDFFPPPEKQQIKNETEESLPKGPSRWKKIPLPALMKFGNESSVASFFRNYVKNTKVVKDSVTLEEYLENSDGQPILDGNKKVVVTPHKEQNLRFHPFGGGVKGRAGGAILEARAKINVDQAVTRAEKQPKSIIALPMCTPEISTVPVPLNSLRVDPSMLVIPKCLKVERCGGCCLSDLTVCEPETKDTVPFTVTVLGYDGDSDGDHPQLQLVNTTTVEVERHKSCKCKCRTKKEHCKSRHHKYEESQCSCICTNKPAYEACVENPDNRFWDHETCQCTCQDVRECSSGFKFDFKTCDCQRSAEFEARQLSRGQSSNKTKQTRG